ncbi:hypothetical protein [Desulfotruncus alcoholivorax]|uniref:hypothetical protein n=1 Tax=Desulfotruncus alcoholivorax TaxID=265477 RepID=UPI0003FB2EE2|nr:hypothetical protein [Desulfotruncus alcoholivorax]
MTIHESPSEDAGAGDPVRPAFARLCAEIAAEAEPPNRACRVLRRQKKSKIINLYQS